MDKVTFEQISESEVKGQAVWVTERIPGQAGVQPFQSPVVSMRLALYRNSKVAEWWENAPAAEKHRK